MHYQVNAFFPRPIYKVMVMWIRLVYVSLSGNSYKKVF